MDARAFADHLVNELTKHEEAFRENLLNGAYKTDTAANSEAVGTHRILKSLVEQMPSILNSFYNKDSAVTSPSSVEGVN